MAAAILQGVPATTLDTDIWIDLPARQYMRVMNLCVSLGAKILANTVVVLPDDSLVNFVYEITGVRSFAAEYRHAERLRWLGESVAVLPLSRILKSKQAIRRPKDLAHIPLLEETLALKRRLQR